MRNLRDQFFEVIGIVSEDNYIFLRDFNVPIFLISGKFCCYELFGWIIVFAVCMGDDQEYVLGIEVPKKCADNSNRYCLNNVHAIVSSPDNEEWGINIIASNFLLDIFNDCWERKSKVTYARRIIYLKQRIWANPKGWTFETAYLLSLTRLASVWVLEMTWLSS